MHADIHSKVSCHIEEVIEFKKGLIDFLKGGTKMKQTKHNITEAILIGKQFAFSMPEEYVEQLKTRREEYLEGIKIENEE